MQPCHTGGLLYKKMFRTMNGAACYDTCTSPLGMLKTVEIVHVSICFGRDTRLFGMLGKPNWKEPVAVVLALWVDTMNTCFALSNMTALETSKSDMMFGRTFPTRDVDDSNHLGE